MKHAAAMTGISPATLRMWERRYEVVVPGRSPSGYRVYDEAAVRRLSAMRALVEAGWSPRLAAEQVKSGTTGGASDPESGRDGPLPAPDAGDIEALARIAEQFDGARLSEILDRAFEGGTFEEVVDGWLMPALHQLGRLGTRARSRSRASTSSAPPCTAGSPPSSTRCRRPRVRRGSSSASPGAPGTSWAFSPSLRC